MLEDLQEGEEDYFDDIIPKEEKEEDSSDGPNYSSLFEFTLALPTTNSSEYNLIENISLGTPYTPFPTSPSRNSPTSPTRISPTIPSIRQTSLQYAQ